MIKPDFFEQSDVLPLRYYRHRSSEYVHNLNSKTHHFGHLLSPFRIPLIFRKSNFDMAAKRHKKHKNKISGFVISMGYNEQKSKF